MTSVGLAQTTVTTSGTTSSGIVPVFNGTATVTNSPIFVSGGNVGIGTTNLRNTLTIAGSGSFTNGLNVTGGYLAVSDTSTGWGGTQLLANTATGHQWTIGQYSSTDSIIWNYYNGSAWQTYRMTLDTSGDLNVPGALTAGGTGSSSFAGNVGIGTTSPSAPLEVDGNVKLTSGSGGSITYADGTTQTTAWTGVLCGGDYAESVDVDGDRTKYKPGDVLVIDPKHPGQFLKSAEPYSTTVTGIYATKPGVVGRRQIGPKQPDEVPMAMIGIVPTRVSAENGPIHAGDLLVTSSTLGHAMKGTDRTRMPGAILGKALGNLDSGRGVIEVVVTLQ